VETGFAVVNGTRLYYEVAGTGDPVVLVHGGLADRRLWDDQFEVFSESHRTIRYDVRGFGKSNLPVEGEPYTHHEDLAALMRHLGVEKAHIVGQSMGSGIAVDFALMHPDMTRSVVSVGPSVNGYDSPTVPKLSEVYAVLASALEEGGVDAVIDLMYDDASVVHMDSTTVNRLKALNREYSWWHLTHVDPRIDIDPAAAERLRQIEVPTLVLTAEYDSDACKEIAGFMERSIDGATKVVIRGAGHNMNMDKPEEFNRIVLDFFGEVARGGACCQNPGEQ
jgi:pimeloyl-ACP methyl ester carboxylesterase